jgi:hypothetical protein
MKIYFKIVFSIALIFGLVTTTQTLLSEPSNVEVATGLVLAVLLCPITYILTKWCASCLFKKKEK